MKKILLAGLVIGLLATGALIAQQQGSTVGGKKAEEKAKETPAATSALKIEKAVVAKGVENREPVEPGDSFPANVGRLFCFVKITGATSPTEIKFIWMKGDSSMGEIAQTVSASPWRTWSSKSIDKSWTGDWKVEVRDADNNLLTTVNFKIQ